MTSTSILTSGFTIDPINRQVVDFWGPKFVVSIIFYTFDVIIVIFL